MIAAPPELSTPLPIEAYLRPSDWLDFDHPEVRAFLDAFPGRGGPPVDVARDLFTFVRDEVAHSWDIQSRRVTGRASEVLRHREGICYAKSHLLAALLRGAGIPAGICYQKLTLFEKPVDGHCIHALNTAYLKGRWVRLDARGNKPGVDARFSLDAERLAFPVREALGEMDYRVNHAETHPQIIRTLQDNDDCRVMYRQGLPTDLTEITT